MNYKMILKRLRNPGTIVTLTSLVLLILTTNGIEINNENVMITVKAVCSVGVILGILNNPDTEGLDLPRIKE